MIARPARRAFVLALILGAGLTPLRATAQVQTLEYPIKAQFLYKFTPFIEWPPGAFEQPVSPVVLCVVGRDPFGGALDRAINGQRLGPRPFVVLRLPHVDPGSGCHLAYISGGEDQPPAAAVQALHGAPVVTVTDEASGAGARGMIHFVVRDRRVRFIIDAGAAGQAGLKISSKLMALGVAE